MYISTQIHGENVLEFFSHETLQHPPALVKGGEMRTGTKSDLVKCILPDSTTSTIDSQPKGTGAVLEGSVLVNVVKPKKNQSFKYYSSEVFYPQIGKHQDLYFANRVDVVFDTYKKRKREEKVFAGKRKRIQWRQRTGKVSFV